MKILSRLLLVLVLGVTALVIVTFVFHILGYVPSEERSRVVVDEHTSLVDRAVGTLSKLSLLPSSRRHRPLFAVMIENHEHAREYQEGLRHALLIEEFLVEGYISRFSAVYDQRTLPQRIGPVRSLRTYFIDGLSPLVPLFIHAGGSPDALDRIDTEESIHSFNAISTDDYSVRREQVPAPHDLFFERTGLRALLEEFSTSSVVWPPYKTGAVGSGALAREIFVEFFNEEHNVNFVFDQWHATYTRTNGGLVSDAHPRNVLVLQMPITNVLEYGRLEIPVQGEGDALLFRSGIVQEGTWQKEDAERWFVFRDADGEELQFAAGQTWVMVLPTLSRVKWE